MLFSFKFVLKNHNWLNGFQLNYELLYFCNCTLRFTLNQILFKLQLNKLETSIKTHCTSLTNCCLVIFICWRSALLATIRVNKGFILPLIGIGTFFLCFFSLFERNIISLILCNLKTLCCYRCCLPSSTELPRVYMGVTWGEISFWQPKLRSKTQETVIFLLECKWCLKTKSIVTTPGWQSKYQNA